MWGNSRKFNNRLTKKASCSYKLNVFVLKIYNCTIIALVYFGFFAIEI